MSTKKTTKKIAVSEETPSYAQRQQKYAKIVAIFLIGALALSFIIPALSGLFI